MKLVFKVPLYKQISKAIENARNSCKEIDHIEVTNCEYKTLWEHCILHTGIYCEKRALTFAGYNIKIIEGEI